jgi:hypothetical protein
MEGPVLKAHSCRRPADASDLAARGRSSPAVLVWAANQTTCPRPAGAGSTHPDIRHCLDIAETAHRTRGHGPDLCSVALASESAASRMDGWTDLIGRTTVRITGWIPKVGTHPVRGVPPRTPVSVSNCAQRSQLPPDRRNPKVPGSARNGRVEPWAIRRNSPVSWIVKSFNKSQHSTMTESAWSRPLRGRTDAGVGPRPQ